MADLQCLTRHESSDGSHAILCPAVGYFCPSHQPGAILQGGDFVGELRIMNTYHDLYLPGNVSGKMIAARNEDIIMVVEYGQELFRLSPTAVSEQEVSAAGTPKSGAQVNLEDEEGFVVSAFTTGIFYKKPGPDAPPFVEIGQEVEKGKALGLIEVMKTFNHIIFQGTDTSDKGRIKKIYVEDAQEVKLGQPIFLIE